MEDQRKRRKTLSKKNWEQSPEWMEKINIVTKCQAMGYSPEQIAAVAKIPDMEVRRILEDEIVACRVAAKNFQEKIPVIKEILGLSLDGLRERLKDLVDPEKRKELLPNMGAMAALTRILVDLNGLLRLEQGQSTENIATVSSSYKETRIMLQDLRKVDPVFEYPELPEATPSNEQ